MAVGGVGGEGTSALDRFQQIRDLAKKKIDASSSTRVDENRARAADLLRKKQAELGQGISDRPRPAAGALQAGATAAGAAVAAKFGIPPAGNIPGGAGAASAYGRSGGTQQADPKPRLGRYIDLTA